MAEESEVEVTLANQAAAALLRRIPAVLCLVLAACRQSAAGTPISSTPACDLSAVQRLYHPQRFTVLGCAEFAGTVLAVLHEPDGDDHLWAAPDPNSERLLNVANVYHGQRALVLEIVPACATEPANSRAAAQCPPSAIAPPAVGTHIRAGGPWVTDNPHGWNEIHPVERLTTA